MFTKLKKILSRLFAAVILAVLLALFVACFPPAALWYVITGQDPTRRLDAWIQSKKGAL